MAKLARDVMTSDPACCTVDTTLDEVARLAPMAARGDAALPARYAHFARGLRHYVLGSADSAAATFSS